MTDSKQRSRMWPRDAGGHIDLEGGTGGITGACACGDFIEFYKEDATFRVRSPESVDPQRTNANAPWVSALHDNVGSSHPAIARVLLQGKEILDAAGFTRPVDKPAVLGKLHEIKEAIVTCDKTGSRIVSSIDGIISEIKAKGLSRTNRAINPFPQVPNLEVDATNFLIHAKRAIQQICALASMFLDVQGDTNFDKLKDRLTATIRADNDLTALIASQAPASRYLIDLRNFQEHPGIRKTVVENFRVMPDGAIATPSWHVSDDPPNDMRDDMANATDFLIESAELILIHLVMRVIDRRFPYVIIRVSDDKIDMKRPIRFRLSVDMTKLKLRADTD